MDQFRSILGDNCDEEEATTAILKHDFDLEKAIDDVLNKGKPGILHTIVLVWSMPDTCKVSCKMSVYLFYLVAWSKVPDCNIVAPL
jgi:hypothetical protein